MIMSKLITLVAVAVIGVASCEGKDTTSFRGLSFEAGALGGSGDAFLEDICGGEAYYTSAECKQKLFIFGDSLADDGLNSEYSVISEFMKMPSVPQTLKDAIKAEGSPFPLADRNFNTGKGTVARQFEDLLWVDVTTFAIGGARTIEGFGCEVEANPLCNCQDATLATAGLFDNSDTSVCTNFLTIRNMEEQVDQFFEDVPSFRETDVAVVVLGGNDLLALGDKLTEIATAPAAEQPALQAQFFVDVLALSENFAKTMSAQVDRLVAAGLKVIVIGPPPAFLTPLAQQAGAAGVGAFTIAVNNFIVFLNNQLKPRVDAGEVFVFELTPFLAGEAARLEGLGIDIVNACVTGECNVLTVGGCAASGCDATRLANSMWLDGVHPTGATSELVARELVRQTLSFAKWRVCPDAIGGLQGVFVNVVRERADLPACRTDESF